MKKHNIKIGSIIKKYRVEAGLTQMGLAQKLGYEIPQFISLIENGHSKAPLNVVAQLIQIIDIPEQIILAALTESYTAEAKEILQSAKKKKSTPPKKKR